MAIIRYGINRRRPGSRSKKNIEHRNFSMTLEGIEWNDEGISAIREEILRRHPGWCITGYLIASPEIQDEVDTDGRVISDADPGM